MKTNKFVLSSVLMLILAALSGCARYKVKPLRMLTRAPKTEESSISFDYEVFSVSDCKKYLDRNPIKKGYQPVQIAFTNNTNRNFSISKKSFSIACIDAQEVAETVHTNTVGRAVGYGVAGFFVWPFIIPAIVDGIGSAKANEQLDDDFMRKELRSQTVKPHTTVNGLIFISCDDDIDETFTLTVTDQKSNSFVLSLDKPKLKI
jgi:hypothetical protein